jgi:pyruvate,water dikinase
MDRWITDTEPTDRLPAFTRGNAGEVFPEPASPFFATTYLKVGLDQGLRDAYTGLGVFDYGEDQNPTDRTKYWLFGVHGGYVYNPLSLTRLFGARMPGATPEAIDKAFFDERDEVPAYRAEPWHDSPANSDKLAATAGWCLTTESLPNPDRDKALAEALRASRPDLTASDIPALLARVRSLFPYVRLTFSTAMTCSTLVSVGPGVLGAICESLGQPTSAISLIGGIEVDSAEPPKAMWALSRLARVSDVLTGEFEAGTSGLDARLRASKDPAVARFVAAFDDFLFHFGSRGPNEYDAMADSWEVNPDVAMAAIDRMRVTDDTQDPSLRRGVTVAERERVRDEIRAKLAGDDETLATFDAGYRSAHLFLAARERCKTNVIKVIGEIRMAMREVGRKLVAAGVLSDLEHVFMITGDELDEFQIRPERFGSVLAERAQQWDYLRTLEPPFAVDAVCPPISTWKPRAQVTGALATVGTVLTGVAGSGGVATGRARVILDPMDPRDLEPGDVLIAPQTDPSWGPLFVPAAAVVVNVGAMGSHAMIVSRELGIPCVASVEGATVRIPDGAMIRVDGNAGTVTVLSL